MLSLTLVSEVAERFSLRTCKASESFYLESVMSRDELHTALQSANIAYFYQFTLLAWCKRSNGSLGRVASHDHTRP